MPADVLDYYANNAELMDCTMPSNISCAALIGNVFRLDDVSGLLFTFQSPDGYEASVYFLSAGYLTSTGATFVDGVYALLHDIDIDTGDWASDSVANEKNQGDSIFYYIPTDFTVQFYDSTENVYVTYLFSECNVFFLAGNQVIDVSNKEEKTLINSFANDEVSYKTYAMDETDSPLLSGMSCLEMLGHVYKLTFVDGTYFTVKTADGVEIELKFFVEKGTLYTDYGDIEVGYLMIYGHNDSISTYILLSGDMVIPISETETVLLGECTLVSTPALICIPDVAIDGNNK